MSGASSARHHGGYGLAGAPSGRQRPASAPRESRNYDRGGGYGSGYPQGRGPVSPRQQQPREPDMSMMERLAKVMSYAPGRNASPGPAPGPAAAPAPSQTAAAAAAPRSGPPARPSSPPAQPPRGWPQQQAPGGYGGQQQQQQATRQQAQQQQQPPSQQQQQASAGRKGVKLGFDACFHAAL